MVLFGKAPSALDGKSNAQEWQSGSDYNNEEKRQSSSNFLSPVGFAD